MHDSATAAARTAVLTGRCHSKILLHEKFAPAMQSVLK